MLSPSIYLLALVLYMGGRQVLLHLNYLRKEHILSKKINEDAAFKLIDIITRVLDILEILSVKVQRKKYSRLP